ncbi:MAG: amidase [Gemmatimonadaceae bacterium]|nr:amidase [Gemmatimonadaceae bacterium]
MRSSRRDALAQLGALIGVPLLGWPAFRDDDPLGGTVAAFQAGRARGVWTAAEVTARALERARAHNGRLRAVAAFAPDALEAARASDARATAGRLHGPLDGVPVFAKSIHDMRGLPTDASNAEWVRLFPEPVSRDAVEVARLRAAGAVILGKTAADDFAYRGIGDSTATGRVRNPYDPADARTAGGSSAGSAVAMACGFGFGALGTDDGGSNRIPAQCCGIVGMKPTFGRIPRLGVIPTWPVLDTHGPLARTAEDAALLFRVLDGADAADALDPLLDWVPPRMRARPATRLPAARVGVVQAHVPRAQMTPEARALFDRAVADLRATGTEVVDVEAPVTLHTFRAQFAAAATAHGDPAPDARAAAATANALLRYFAGRTDDPRGAFRRGYAAYRHYYDVLPVDADAALALADTAYERLPAVAAFVRARRTVIGQLAAAMSAQRVEALLYPTMPFAAFGADGVWPDIRTPLGYGNWLGLPEVSVPAGLGADGVPGLNISFVGLPMHDEPLLALAMRYERASRRYTPPPLD